MGRAGCGARWLWGALAVAGAGWGVCAGRRSRGRPGGRRALLGHVGRAQLVKVELALLGGLSRPLLIFITEERLAARPAQLGLGNTRRVHHEHARRFGLESIDARHPLARPDLAGVDSEAAFVPKARVRAEALKVDRVALQLVAQAARVRVEGDLRLRVLDNHRLRLPLRRAQPRPKPIELAPLPLHLASVLVQLGQARLELPLRALELLTRGARGGELGPQPRAHLLVRARHLLERKRLLLGGPLQLHRQQRR